MAFGHILFIFSIQLLKLVCGQPTTNYADPEVYHQHNSEVLYSLQKLNQKVDTEMLKCQNDHAEMLKTFQELNQNIDSMKDCLFNGSTKMGKCLPFIQLIKLALCPLYIYASYQM